MKKVTYLLQNSGTVINIPISDRRPRVLIIDDDVSLTLKVIQALQPIGVNAAATAGGLTGLSKIKEFSPDLIILDIILPELNGLQVLQYVKRIYNVPVIMIPGIAEADLLRKALVYGADSYLIKPFDANALVSFVQKKLVKMQKLQVAD